MHLDSAGNLTTCCEHLLPSSLAPGLTGVVRAADGGYYIIGGLRSDAYTARLNSDGDTLWTRMYGGTQYDCGQAIAAVSGGGCFSAG